MTEYICRYCFWAFQPPTSAIVEYLLLVILVADARLIARLLLEDPHEG